VKGKGPTPPVGGAVSSHPFSAWELGLAIRYLRAKRKDGGVALISIISFLGVLASVALLICTMAIMNGFRSDLLSRIVGFQSHIYVQGAVIDQPGREAMLTRLRAVPGVVQVAPKVENETLVLAGRETQGAIVRGVTPENLRETRIISKHIVQGSMADFGKGDYGGDTVLLGDRLADALGVAAGDPVTLISPSSSTPFGSTLQQKTYRVGGVFSIGMAEFDLAYIFMPLDQAQLFFGKEGVWDEVDINVVDPDHLDAIKAEVAKIAGPGAVVTDWRDRNRSFFNALQVEHVVMRLILMMIVAIAALNIISGLIMLVKNKGRDIAILRTMGASQGAIMRIFFVAGSSIGVAGTLIGVTLGVLFCTFVGPIQHFLEWLTHTKLFPADVYYLNQIPAKMQWSEVLGIVIFSLACSCLATLAPAWRASRIDPVEALRYE
jgi:lipoprotein-releasing system permease protein